MRQYVILIIALVIGVMLMGCTTPSAPAAQTSQSPASQLAAPASAPAPTGPTAQITIRDMAFNPSILNVRTGTTVVWTNDDKGAHRVVHMPGNNQDELFHSDRLDPGQSFSYTFTKPGRYSYADPQNAGGRTSLIIVE